MNTPTGIRIRPAAPADHAAIEQCLIELQDFESSLESDRLPGATVAHDYLQELLATCQQKQGQIFVAVRESIVGFVCVWLEMEPENRLTSLSQYAYISDLVVLPPYRRRGIGKALLEQAEALASQHQATALRINALAANRDARSLYEHVGFRDYEISLIKALR